MLFLHQHLDRIDEANTDELDDANEDDTEEEGLEVESDSDADYDNDNDDDDDEKGSRSGEDDVELNGNGDDKENDRRGAGTMDDEHRLAGSIVFLAFFDFILVIYNSNFGLRCNRIHFSVQKCRKTLTVY